MKKRNAIIFLLLIVMVMTSACSQGVSKSGNADFVVKVAKATEKFTQDEDISSLPEGTLSIAAAKGETEGAQFIVKADKDVASYEFSVSDLKNGSNQIDASAVKVQTELYTYTVPSDGWSDTLPTGYYPDALIPVEYIIQEKENTLLAEKNQAFYVDIKVPKDAVAGTYTGEITMICDGKEIAIPVELQVYDFEISEVPYMKTTYLIWQGWLSYGEWDTSDEKYMDYWDALMEYNLTGYTFPHTTADEFVTYVREYYSKISSYGIPYDVISNTENDWEKYSAYMYELAVASVQDGVNYFDKAYYYFDMYYDEYDMIEWRKQAMQAILDTCDQLEEELVARLVKEKLIDSKNSEMAQDIVNLQHVIPVAGYDPTLEDYEVTFCIGAPGTFSSVQVEDYKKMLKEEQTFYWYHTIGHVDYPYPGLVLNDYTISRRDRFWTNYELGVEGDLYWCVNGYCNWSAVDSAGQYMTLQDVYATANRDSVSNGDGYLMYPGFGYGSDKPFGSLRLVSIRDGIDDNTYMGMLGDAYKELAGLYGADTEDAKSLVSFINKNIVTRQVSKLNHEKLLDGRESIAQAIVLANKQGVVFDEMSVDQNQLKYTIYTDASTQLKVNGSAVTATTAGEGKCYSETIELPKSGKLTLEFISNGETEKMELWTVAQGTLMNGFESADDVAQSIVYKEYGSNAELNTNASYSKNGNSVKIKLSGHDFGNESYNEQFIPKVGYSLKDKDLKMSEVESIEFWVYNPQSEDIEVQSYLSGDTKDRGTITFLYDTLYLHAKSWTKVTIDNFNYVDRDAVKRDDYTEFGLIWTANHLGVAYDLYIDDLFIR